MVEDDQKLLNEIILGSDQDFKKLFEKYYPVLKKIKYDYYVVGMDNDDWDQEARIVMYKSVQNYQSKYRTSFGSFYRQNLKHRVIDLIRKTNAKKRFPIEVLSSINANESFYDATLLDFKAVNPENSILVGESLEKLYNKCSPLERKVLLTLIYDLSFELNHQTFTNAFERCKTKFRNDTN